MGVACSVLVVGEPAGAAERRFARYHDSGTVLHWAAQCACGSRCSRVSVTLGKGAGDVVDSLRDLPVEVIQGFDWREGAAAATRAATLWAIDRGADALLVCSAEHPFLTTRHLNALWFASDQGTRLVASYYSGMAGVPAVFPARYYGGLLALRGDEDAQTLLRVTPGAVCIAWPEGAIEVEAPSEVSQVF